jgi:hypothetical protein
MMRVLNETKNLYINMIKKTDKTEYNIGKF